MRGRTEIQSLACIPWGVTKSRGSNYLLLSGWYSFIARNAIASKEALDMVVMSIVYVYDQELWHLIYEKAHHSQEVTKYLAEIALDTWIISELISK